MSDIVERLRALSACLHDDHSVGDEAADEIDRLRAEVAQYARHPRRPNHTRVNNIWPTR